MEELDTEVKGDPDSFTATCEWLRGAADNAQEVEDGFSKARTTSESGWSGPAGDAFREVVFRGVQVSTDVLQAVSGVCSAMEIHADDLRTVETKMQQARDVAAEGGLTIRGFKIQPPGPAPAAPGKLPKGASPEQRRQHTAAVVAEEAYAKKVQAYEEAAALVAEARKKESESQHVVIRSISGVTDPVKGALSLTDVSAGVTGAIAARASKYKAIAANIKSPALAEKMAANPSWSAKGRFRAAQIAAERSAAKATALAEAYPNRIAAAIDKWVPDRVKQLADAKVIPAKTPTPTNWLLKGSTKLGKNLPVVGTIATGFGVWYDVEQGKDPAQAVVSGGSSLVAGAVTGAAIGGPVGAVAGAVVGIGVGIAVDETWSLFD